METPRGTPAESFDYEGEIAVVIGKTARHVTPVQAVDHVLGYAPFNDGSVREWQKHSIYAGKNFANSGSWGPWIATADDLPPVEDLHLTVTLNGETMQSAYGQEMIFSLPEQIAYASSLFTLYPFHNRRDGMRSTHNLQTSMMAMICMTTLTCVRYNNDQCMHVHS